MSAHALAICTIPPLPDTIEFPPLPVIHYKRIEAQVFTHSSFYSSQPRKTTSLIQAPDQDLNMDNEKLEHVGDALLGGSKH